MIDQNSTDADLEALLRATFDSEARNQVSDSRPVPPFPEASTRLATVHPLRRKWLGISVVAAALVAVAVGASVIGSEAMHSEHRPIPPATSGAPTPTAPPDPTTSPTTSPTTTAATTGSTTPPAPTTKQVTFEGVRLTVPTSWNVVDRAVGETGTTPSVCLTTDTAIHTTGIDTYNCRLSLSVGASLWGDHDVDRAGFAPDGGICGTDNRRPHETDTVVADEVVVDGQTAEHRSFSGDCLDHPLDQWTVPTAPFVQFWRDFGPTADAAGAAQALAVVRSATLPGPRSALRLTDHGYITAVSGNTVSLDRITDLNQLGIQNNNPTTYAYPMAKDAVIDGDSVDGDLPFRLGPGDLRALAAGQLSGVPPLDRLLAIVTTDGTEVTGIHFSARS